MKRMTSIVLAVIAAMAVRGVSQAATISYVGSVEGTEVREWRTEATKTYDIDGDDIYGSSLGAVHWTVVGINEHPGGSADFGWAYLGETTFGQFRNPDYPLIDKADAAPADIQAGIAAVQFPGLFNFELTGVPADYAGKTVRVGIMGDVLGPAESPIDGGKSYQLVQTVGGAGSSPVVSLRGGAIGDSVPEMYFFDIEGATSGDRFQVIAFQGPNLPGYIGPMSWDIAPTVPEPATWSLLVLGTVGLAVVARRRGR